MQQDRNPRLREYTTLNIPTTVLVSPRHILAVLFDSRFSWQYIYRPLTVDCFPIPLASLLSPYGRGAVHASEYVTLGVLRRAVHHCRCVAFYPIDAVMIEGIPSLSTLESWCTTAPVVVKVESDWSLSVFWW